MVTPLPADQQNNVQIVCKTDPVTGKVTQQVVQTITNTETGETTQLPVETSTGTLTNLISKNSATRKSHIQIKTCNSLFNNLTTFIVDGIFR